MVRILDAQDELTAVLAGEHEVEQGHVGRAHVRITRGRWRHAGSNCLVVRIFQGCQSMESSREMTIKNGLAMMPLSARFLWHEGTCCGRKW